MIVICEKQCLCACVHFSVPRRPSSDIVSYYFPCVFRLRHKTGLPPFHCRNWSASSSISNSEVRTKSFTLARHLFPIALNSILGFTIYMSVDMITTAAVARKWAWARSALHQPLDKVRQHSYCKPTLLHFNARHIKHRMMSGVPKKRTNLRIKAFPVSPLTRQDFSVTMIVLLSCHT